MADSMHIEVSFVELRRVLAFGATSDVDIS